ncbi:protease [Streptomyces sp. NA04227]|uniref:protease n=1 Tax=Streptomyces sp. NA04227 TaxID=2742136 RepID=UPI001591F1F2|nr:protease [Streptomyces sp. NA04227]QKW08527.1 protease [Streptomyces sp. NA04227]
MTKLLLSLHVLAAVLAVGPVTVAASMFPAYLRRAQAEAGPVAGSGPVTGSGSSASGIGSVTESGTAARAGTLVVLRTLHRICRVYATIGLAVPLLGFATALSLGVLDSAWLIVSIGLTALAGAILALLMLPWQQEALDAVEAGADEGADRTEGDGSGGAAPGADGTEDGAALDPRAARMLAMVTGIFNLLWATVTVLMVVRPGSTTGA